MKFPVTFAALLACLVSNVAAAQVQFHRAYMRPVAGSEPATFSNDRLFKFFSTEPLIRSSELTKATVLVERGQATLEIGISAAARKKFNDLAARNIHNQEKGAFEDHIGLAVLVDGKPIQVIQGIFQPLDENKMWWSPADDRLPLAEQLRISKEIAAKIARAGQEPSAEKPAGRKPARPSTTHH